MSYMIALPFRREAIHYILGIIKPHLTHQPHTLAPSDDISH
jgi:hypothetical protein